MRVALAAIQGMVMARIYCIMRATPSGRPESETQPGVRPLVAGEGRP
jgi:hypothetical protein